MTNEILIKKIKEKIKEKNLTNKEVFTDCGFSEQHFYDLMSGKTPVINKKHLKMFKLLEIKIK